MNYWEKATSKRLGRRRALVATGGAAAAAAFLAACGEDDDGAGMGGSGGATGGGATGSGTGSSQGTSSGLITQHKDTTSEAVKGGVWKDVTIREPANLGPYIRDISTTFHVLSTYQTLVRTRATAFKGIDPEVVDPEGAESWELSPDKLTVTFKIQPNARFDEREPTNGRNVTAEDVAYSWKLFEEISTIRAELSHNINPASPIESVTATDESTVTMKLAMPSTTLMSQLRNYSASGLMISPVEAEDKFDIKRETRASGPWRLVEYEPSSRLVYERSPNYWDPERPFIERREQPIIPEYSAGLSQFKTGSLYTWNVRGEDILLTKAGVPDLQMVPTIVNGAGYYWFYGWNEGSQFRDQRVRQALQAAIDRDLFIETFYNIANFEAEGLPMETRWSSSVNCNFTDWWLDPQSSDFGENAKYYQYNLEEAKKLLAAAGYEGGFDTESPHVTTPNYGADYPRFMEVMLNMAADTGIRATISPLDYNTEWPQVRDAKGAFNGVSAGLAGPQSRTYIFAIYNKNGSLFHGFDPDGSGSFAGDPHLDELTEKLISEFDREAAIGIAHEIQRYDAKTLYAPFFPGGANSFRLAWPVVRNFGVYEGDNTAYYYYWLDETRKPVGTEGPLPA